MTTIVSDYIDSSGPQIKTEPCSISPNEVPTGSPSTPNSNGHLDQCNVCHDIASGVHYGVPACEGCKGFFRRIVSSHNVGAPCSHDLPIDITPQTRNSCQWCRLKKCCSVNMGRQRSRLGRRAKNKPDPVPESEAGMILLPGTASNTSPADISNHRLLQYIEDKRREFETQVSRRSRKSKHDESPQSSEISMNMNINGSSLLTTTNKDFNSLLQSRLAGRTINSDLGVTSPPHLAHSSPESSGEEPSMKCLKLLQRHADSTLSSSGGTSPSRSCAPKKVWLEKSQIHSNSVTNLCTQLAGSQHGPKLEELYSRYAFNNAVYQLVLTACCKFVRYWEEDLNTNFVSNPSYCHVIKENISLILEGHRKTFFFCNEFMKTFYQTKFHLLRVPTRDEEMKVAKNIVSYIPVIIMRIVAFTKNIFGGSGSYQTKGPLPNDPNGAYHVTRSSDVITEEDKTKLVRQHTFKLVGIRFCAALVCPNDDFIIDPQQEFKITKSCLLNSQNAVLKMLSPLFLKFFDVAAKWHSLSTSEDEMAFMSAICLTSPYFGVSHPEDIFEDLDSILRVHSAIIGQFFIFLRQKLVDDLHIPLSKLQQNSEINIDLRIKVLHRIFELFTVFIPILSIDGFHQHLTAMEHMFKLVESAAPAPVAGLPNMTDPGHSVHTSVSDSGTYTAGTHAYRDIFKPH